MKTGISSLIIVSFFLVSCVSIPRESIELSKVLGNDLIALHTSHRQLTSMYFRKIKEDINVFVDEVYSPFVIHYVLNVELERHKEGGSLLFNSVENAARFEGIAESEEALKTILEFHQAANVQIQSMRTELIEPVIKQEMQVIDALNNSYEQAIHANLTITGYLESVRKVRDSQQEVFAMVGLQGTDSLITSNLLRISELVNAAVKKGKEIDVKSEDALFKMEEISSQIKNLTN